MKILLTGLILAASSFSMAKTQVPTCAEVAAEIGAKTLYNQKGRGPGGNKWWSSEGGWGEPKCFGSDFTNEVHTHTEIIRSFYYFDNAYECRIEEHTTQLWSCSDSQ